MISRHFFITANLVFCAIFASSLAHADAPLSENDKTRLRLSREGEPSRFEFSFAPELEVAQNKIGWLRLYESDDKPSLDLHFCGKNGAPLREEIHFHDLFARPVGVLKIAFDATGRVEKAEFAGANTTKQAPKIGEGARFAVPEANASVSWSVKDGKIVRRALSLQSPIWTGQIVSSYDAQGRRVRDVFERALDKEIGLGAKTVEYFYGANGLERIVSTLKPGATARILKIVRRANGALAELRVFDGETPFSATIMLRDEAGTHFGTRLESWENGVFKGAQNTKILAGKTVEEQFNAKNLLQLRRTTDNQTQKFLLEEYFSDGKPTTKTIYNADGTFKIVK